ncbi:hypothetical protein GCM10023223_32460 [Stackebrandtia albiflava]
MCAGTAAVLLAGSAPATATEASDRPMASASFNDTVLAVVHHAGRVYAGGEFSYAFQSGRRLERHHLAATTTDGELTGFAPEVDGPVHALATDGRHLYAAGRFRAVDGVERRRLARFSLDTGELDPDFTVRVDALPRALEVHGDTLYLGGDFHTVDGQPRERLAAVSTDDGSLLPDFAPRFDQAVRTIDATNHRVYVGGGFTAVNGTAARNLAAVDPRDGSLVAGFAPRARGVVHDLDVSGPRVYAATGGPGGRVHAFESDGVTAWERAADGDVAAVTVRDGVVYAGGHFTKVCEGGEVDDRGDCLGVTEERQKFMAVTTENALRAWNPHADSVMGALTIASGDDVLVAGGDFLTFAAGTVRQRGLALFPS